jgi:aldehyde dehydrogenase (NAD+)
VLVGHPEVEVVAFTGSVPVGKKISATAGYKKLVLELGGNDPLIVLEDADMDLAITLAAEGSYRNSGQRCTAVKRILVQESIAEEFTRRLVEKTREYVCGNPMDEATKVGTVIDEASALSLEAVVQEAVAQGARVLIGGERHGALMQPTVIDRVPRDCHMVVCESFGPLAPIVTIRDLDDALTVANSTAYGLSSGVVTNNMAHALKAIRTLRCGTVNINEVPGFQCPTPAGAFYVYPSVKGALGKSIRGKVANTSADLATIILEEVEVAAVPGEAFGPSGYLRFSYATSDEDIVEGIGRIKKLLSE